MLWNEYGVFLWPVYVPKVLATPGSDNLHILYIYLTVMKPQETVFCHE